MRIWYLEQAESDDDGGYFPGNIDSKRCKLAIRYAGFKNKELLELEQGNKGSPATINKRGENDTPDDLGHVIPVMLQDESLGTSEAKAIREKTQDLVEKDENDELGLIWIFNKSRKNDEEEDDDEDPLIKPKSILLLAQFTFKGPIVVQKKTAGYHFFNPTDLEYKLAKKMPTMIDSK
ncbi:unnamed protein product, partial [Mesorhabditis belari]|uniref:Uncharacterized protein n=1 Tax=Mesorhabditis belari TaxID=2138241 RepID=A0AAF3F7B1_9BILA